MSRRNQERFNNLRGPQQFNTLPNHTRAWARGTPIGPNGHRPRRIAPPEPLENPKSPSSYIDMTPILEQYLLGAKLTPHQRRMAIATFGFGLALLFLLNQTGVAVAAGSHTTGLHQHNHHPGLHNGHPERHVVAPTGTGTLETSPLNTPVNMLQGLKLQTLLKAFLSQSPVQPTSQVGQQPNPASTPASPQTTKPAQTNQESLADLQLRIKERPKGHPALSLANIRIISEEGAGPNSSYPLIYAKQSPEPNRFTVHLLVPEESNIAKVDHPKHTNEIVFPGLTGDQAESFINGLQLIQQFDKKQFEISKMTPDDLAYFINTITVLNSYSFTDINNSQRAFLEQALQTGLLRPLHDKILYEIIPKYIQNISNNNNPEKSQAWLQQRQNSVITTPGELLTYAIVQTALQQATKNKYDLRTPEVYDSALIQAITPEFGQVIKSAALPDSTKKAIANEILRIIIQRQLPRREVLGRNHNIEYIWQQANTLLTSIVFIRYGVSDIDSIQIHNVSQLRKGLASPKTAEDLYLLALTQEKDLSDVQFFLTVHQDTGVKPFSGKQLNNLQALQRAVHKLATRVDSRRIQLQDSFSIQTSPEAIQDLLKNADAQEAIIQRIQVAINNNQLAIPAKLKEKYQNNNHELAKLIFYLLITGQDRDLISPLMTPTKG